MKKNKVATGLLPCPHCGRKEDEFHRYSRKIGFDVYYCIRCYCLAETSGWTEEEAEKTWNARVEQGQGEPVAQVVSKHGDPEAFGEREIEVLADLSKIAYDTKLYTHSDPAEVEGLQRRIANAELALRAQTQNCNTLRAQLAEAQALLREKDDVLMAVKEQFDRHGNEFPDRFDSRVFRWVNDAVGSTSTEPIEIDEFCEGQWWIVELDALAEGGSIEQKRAVAVVRNMMWQLNQIREDMVARP